MPDIIPNTPPSESEKPDAKQLAGTRNMNAAQPSPPSNEADLLTLQAERRKLYAEIEAVPDDEDHDRKIGEICPRAWGITDISMGADIPTVPAVLVQFHEMIESHEGSDIPRDTIKGLIERLSTALDRPALANFPGTDPLVALGADYEAVRLACFPPGGGPDLTDEKHAEYTRRQRLIIDTPATTFAGVIVRLRLVLAGLAPDSDPSIHDEALCRAVIEDIERLAGNGS